MYEYPKITNVFKRNMDAPDVVAVEYLGAEHKNALKKAYKEITPIECIKAL